MWLLRVVEHEPYVSFVHHLLGRKVLAEDAMNELQRLVRQLTQDTTLHRDISQDTLAVLILVAQAQHKALDAPARGVRLQRRLTVGDQRERKALQELELLVLAQPDVGRSAT